MQLRIGNFLANQITLLSIVWGVQAFAFQVSDPSTLLSARAQARGGATGATTHFHDSLFQNPASAVFTSKYAVSVGYTGWGDSLAASIVDTQSGPVGGGVYYVRRDLTTGINDNSGPIGDYARLEEHMGLALLGKFGKSLGVGTNVRYLYRKNSVDPSIPNTSTWNFDIGMRFLASEKLRFGAIAQNMLLDDLGVYPRRFVGALEFSLLPTLVVSAQVFKIDTSKVPAGFSFPNSGKEVGSSFGAEYVTPLQITVRAGYVNNPTWNQTLATAGLGYAANEFAIDYAIQKGLKNSTANIHMFSVTGYF
jgi:hypothetical protein